LGGQIKPAPFGFGKQPTLVALFTIEELVNGWMRGFESPIEPAPGPQQIVT
jgi:hypothetical protein